jgi:hypothetical protein
MKRALLFMISMVVVVLLGASCPKARRSTPAEKIAAQEPSTIDVYYFHRTERCPSCITIEALAKQAVDEAFAGELAAGRTTWRSINIDEPENRHFEDEYRLQVQSVIVSESRAGKQVRWKNLEKVWDLLGDDQAFIRYVQDEIRAYAE